MSIGDLVAMATSALKALLYKQGQRQTATLSASTGDAWTDSGAPFPLMYEAASAISQGAFDYQAPAGYGYDVRCLPDQPMAAGDRIVVASDGVTFEVVEARPVGAPEPLKLLRCKLVV